MFSCNTTYFELISLIDMPDPNITYESPEHIRSRLQNLLEALRFTDRLELVISRGQLATELIDELALSAEVEPEEIGKHREDVTAITTTRIKIILINKVRSLLSMQSKVHSNRGKALLLGRIITELEGIKDQVEKIIHDHNLNDIIRQIKEVQHTFEAWDDQYKE